MPHDPRHFGELIEHARTELRGFESDEVPEPLRRVAAYSGPRLPPPLATRLLAEIDESEWLRSRLAATWPTDRAEHPGGLFLMRPDGWEESLGAARDQATRRAEDARADEMERRIAALESELAVARRRAKRAQREAELAVAEADKRITAARSAATASRQRESDELGALRRDNTTLSKAVEEASRDLESSRERMRALRAELLRARRAGRPRERTPSPSVWADLDALDKARLLDDVRTAFGPAAAFDEVASVGDPSELQLPVGVRPDRREAIEWLLDQDAPVTLLVDGYNVTHLVSPTDPTGAQARTRLNRDLARLRRLLASASRVVVVYDSSVDGGTTTSTGPGGIEVRFTTDGYSADDEILYAATELGGHAVVITNDRRVREGSERVGALGLWSEAIAAWIRRT